MPLVRKIVKIGSSRGITLPEDWLRWLEMKLGEKPEAVLIEVDEELRIKPIVKAVVKK
jgi:antitoxin component of MazEF toxin-antitoxin module